MITSKTENSYFTIEGTSEGFYKEKGSKFFAFAVPCKTEQEVRTHLNTWRKEHHQAVHVCYAFRFGSDKKHFRASDDGEPSNSAGPPILGQIVAYDLTNILIGIVRYYGGTNLGVGGLINAYRTAAKNALENAVIIEQEDKLRLEIQFAYEQLPEVMTIIKSAKYLPTRHNFGLTCSLELEISFSDSSFVKQLSEIKNIELINHGIRT